MFYEFKMFGVYTTSTSLYIGTIFHSALYIVSIRELFYGIEYIPC